MSIIPKARVIEVENPPVISSVELIKQVIENISAQITSLDQEIAAASKGDAAAVVSSTLFFSPPHCRTVCSPLS